MQSVADPANVEQALDSVGDAVENAVPDPKGAESGLAPTADKQVSTTDSGKYTHCVHSVHQSWVVIPLFGSGVRGTIAAVCLRCCCWGLHVC